MDEKITDIAVTLHVRTRTEEGLKDGDKEALLDIIEDALVTRFAQLKGIELRAIDD